MAYGHGLPHSSPLSISGGLRKRHRPPPPEVPEGVLWVLEKRNKEKKKPELVQVGGFGEGSGQEEGLGDEAEACDTWTLSSDWSQAAREEDVLRSGSRTRWQR